MATVTTSGVDALDRLCKRFVVAVGNFGRSCISLQSNERSFQAWYAASVIQEFGLSQVYREVHLKKESLFREIKDRPFHPFFSDLRKGHELFPDLSISWEPDLDTRHSDSRDPQLAPAGAMLSKLAIVTELKVTGSTGVATAQKDLLTDLRKLALFAAAREAWRPSASATAGAHGERGPERRLATYMVILNNFRSSKGRANPRYHPETLRRAFADAAKEWPSDLAGPTTLLLSDEGHTVLPFRVTAGA